MSRSTHFVTDLVFFDKTYAHKEQVTNDLRETEARIAELKKDLFVFAYMTEPEKFNSTEGSAGYFIESSLNAILEEMEELYVLKEKLMLLEERWDDCHNENGLAIEPEETMKSYIWGDFVPSVKNPDPNKIDF